MIHLLSGAKWDDNSSSGNLSKVYIQTSFRSEEEIGKILSRWVLDPPGILKPCNEFDQFKMEECDSKLS
jgi:hypothetical protein